jgi:hypothetical protein
VRYCRVRAAETAPGPTKSGWWRGEDAGDAALEAGKNALSDAGITTDAAKAKLAELTEDAKHVAKDVAGRRCLQGEGAERGGGSAA